MNCHVRQEAALPSGRKMNFNVDCYREYFRPACRLAAQVFEILRGTGSNRHPANNLTEHTSPRRRGRQGNTMQTAILEILNKLAIVFGASQHL